MPLLILATFIYYSLQDEMFQKFNFDTEWAVKLISRITNDEDIPIEGHGIVKQVLNNLCLLCFCLCNLVCWGLSRFVLYMDKCGFDMFGFSVISVFQRYIFLLFSFSDMLLTMIVETLLNCQLLGLQINAEKYFFGIRKSLVEFDEVLEVCSSCTDSVSAVLMSSFLVLGYYPLLLTQEYVHFTIKSTNSFFNNDFAWSRSCCVICFTFSPSQVQRKHVYDLRQLILTGDFESCSEHIFKWAPWFSVIWMPESISVFELIYLQSWKVSEFSYLEYHPIIFVSFFLKRHESFAPHSML